jgi:lipoate-protein ligase A
MSLVVQLDVVENRLVNVHIRGDDVPASLAAALSGTPADLDVPALAARIRAAMPFDAALPLSPEAVAAAVRRAVNAPPRERIGSFTSEEIDRLTAGWKSLPWRLLPERELPPALNVALDEVLTASERPALRFWRWSAPAVIIGRSQSVRNEVDPIAASELGVQVIRRLTGGGAMFLQPHGAITYSLYLPESAVAGLSIRQSYEVCEAWVIRALRQLGVDAHHVPVNDIACADGKIGGAAQARRRGVVLHHTTIAHDMDPGDMARVLRIGRAKLKERATPSAAKRVSPLARQTSLPRDAVAAHLFAAFRATFGGTVGEVTTEELRDAERFVAAKYGHADWTNEVE